MGDPNAHLKDRPCRGGFLFGLKLEASPVWLVGFGPIEQRPCGLLRGDSGY